jgi:valyl-tRNA synthetase
MQITSAHDTKDFKARKWHGVDSNDIFTHDWNIIENGGPWFEGRPCSTAWDAIIDAVKAKVLFNYLALPFPLQFIL